eukprot:TRINITY_DN25382_c0_g1_i2.p1 TRINITY_DN25382_c0_g1~~TRINITY_DN25382_c0_g1_i2.p1  ORF type:complete len:658 (-),score=114.80 TRINITY_DN25382_c0_g1_i2:245-2218(-)
MGNTAITSKPNSSEHPSLTPEVGPPKKKAKCDADSAASACVLGELSVMPSNRHTRSSSNVGEGLSNSAGMRDLRRSDNTLPSEELCDANDESIPHVRHHKTVLSPLADSVVIQERGGKNGQTEESSTDWESVRHAHCDAGPATSGSCQNSSSAPAGTDNTGHAVAASRDPSVQEATRLPSNEADTCNAPVEAVAARGCRMIGKRTRANIHKRSQGKTSAARKFTVMPGAFASRSRQKMKQKTSMLDGRHESSMVAPSTDTRKPRILLVVGECGDGKSTLVNALRDPERSGVAESGLKSRGVTKTIQAYIGKPIKGQAVDFLDTPGVGDRDVTPMKVLSLIEQELISQEIGGADAIDGVIVTTPVPDGRVKLGAQVVQLLVEHGFVGEKKWENVILVGTKEDRASPEELEFFKNEIAADFFASAPGQAGCFVTTKKDDYSSLQSAIARLPSLKVRYGSPDPAMMAEAFAETLGVNKETFTKELIDSREALQKEFDRQFKEQEEKLQQERKAMHDKFDEQQRDTGLATQRLKQEMEAKLEENERMLESLRKAGPEERKALERQFAELQSELQRSQETHAAASRLMDLQLQEQEQRLRQLVLQLEEKTREAARERARNYNFGMASAAQISRGCLHPRRRKWANAGHGRGSKCIDCRAECG